MAAVVGLDLGLSLARPTTGVARFAGLQVELAFWRGGVDACAAISAAGTARAIAIDGPIIPAGVDQTVVRDVERLFASGTFQRRCKPGFSHVEGTGFQLRQAAGQAADRLATTGKLNEVSATFPRVRPAPLVEAFPNAFLGVCVDEGRYTQAPRLRRGEKLDWLYDCWAEDGLFARLPLRTELDSFREGLASVKHHGRRGALVCLLTGLLVAQGAFTAVGDDTGGWFFLPPWEAWQPWAREAAELGIANLNKNGAKLRIERGRRLDHSAY